MTLVVLFKKIRTAYFFHFSKLKIFATQLPLFKLLLVGRLFFGYQLRETKIMEKLYHFCLTDVFHTFFSFFKLK